MPTVHYKIDSLLSEAHRAEYAALLARVPAPTVDECWEWLQERGYQIARSSVGRHKRSFEEVMSDVQKSSELARSFVEMAKASGGVAVADAAVMQLSQLIFEAGMSAREGGEVSTEEIGDLALAMQRLTLAKKNVENVRTEFVEREKAAITAAKDVAAAGGDAGSVVDKVREILGIRS